MPTNDDRGIRACPEYVVLFSGTKVSAKEGAPRIVDIAQSLSRIPRFAGNGWEWFPVALHCFVVADLLPVTMKIYGLLHDACECVGNDVPKPIKSVYTSKLEDELNRRVFLSLGLPELTDEQHKVLKTADNMALLGEIHSIGPRFLKEEYPDRNPRAEKLVMDYYKKYPVHLCTMRGGPLYQEFIRRFGHHYRSRQKWERSALLDGLRKLGAIKEPFPIIGQSRT